MPTKSMTTMLEPFNVDAVSFIVVTAASPASGAMVKAR